MTLFGGGKGCQVPRICLFWIVLLMICRQRRMVVGETILFGRVDLKCVGRHCVAFCIGKYVLKGNEMFTEMLISLSQKYG